MPFALIVRTLARLAATLFAWRMATARRGAYGAAGGPQVRGAHRPRGSRLDSRSAVVRLRESASLGWRVAAAAVLLVAAALLVTGGTTLTVLSPRWLGILLLVTAVAAFAGVIAEVLSARRIVALRRRRRHDADLRRQVG